MTVTLKTILDTVIAPALADLPPKMTSDAAKRMLLAIGLQESGFATVRQYGNGPASGYWQFERGGGVNGVLNHPASAELAKKAAERYGVTPDKQHVWLALGEQDKQILAATFARLLLYTDPHALPVTVKDGWDCYLRNWRPGKPHPDKWPACWTAASKELGLLP